MGVEGVGEGVNALGVAPPPKLRACKLGDPHPRVLGPARVAFPRTTDPCAGPTGFCDGAVDS